MILKTSFMRDNDDSSSPVRKLVEYLDKSQGLYDRCGCEMDESAKERFLESTVGDEMGRLLTASPENKELSDGELSKATRRALEDYLSGRYSADYIMAIHRDTDRPHTQVALSGNEDDLEMDQTDIDDLKQGLLTEFEQEQSLELEQVQLNGRELDGDVADDHSLKIASLDDGKFDGTQTEQQELDQNMGVGQ